MTKLNRGRRRCWEIPCYAIQAVPLFAMSHLKKKQGTPFFSLPAGFPVRSLCVARNEFLDIAICRHHLNTSHRKAKLVSLLSIALEFLYIGFSGNTPSFVFIQQRAFHSHCFHKVYQGTVVKSCRWVWYMFNGSHAYSFKNHYTAPFRESHSYSKQPHCKQHPKKLQTF